MRLILVDTSFLIYRSYFAYPNITNSKGLKLGAVFGLVKTILILNKTYLPERIIFCRDFKKPTFRHIFFSEYKAGRPPMPVELQQQLTLIDGLLEITLAENYALEGFEADDLIASLAYNLNEFDEILIFSGDKDLLQLLSLRNVKIIKPDTLGANLIIAPTDFEKKFNLKPSQWLDYKALVGDTSDNIRGVDGIGPKTATTLLNQFGSLKNIYSFLRLDLISALNNFPYIDPDISITENINFEHKISEKISQKLILGFQDVLLAYRLSQLARPEFELKPSTIKLELAKSSFLEWQFNSILKELGHISTKKPIKSLDENDLFS
jgi:DNA polymerase I